MKPLVVKLGGSTAGHEEMQQWIDALASASFPLAIVPGGGPFADQVRISQKRLRYSDEAAHAMAILAMDQFGLVIAERHQRLRSARTVHEIETALEAGFIPVWLPSTMTTGAAEIPCSWEVTSDSLSAWLASRLQARDLLVIKQTDEHRHYSTVQELAAAGIVDNMLPGMLGEGTTLHMAGPQALEKLHLPLATIPGHVIMRHEHFEAMGAQ
jgi:aspartokinase-like uncharacterized kinase